MMVRACGPFFLVVPFVSHSGDHGSEKVLQVGVEPPVQNGVGDGAQHGERVNHEKYA